MTKLNFLPKSFKGFTVGMTNPNSVVNNLEVLSFPSITDEVSKGTYLSLENLNAKKLKMVQSLIQRRSKDELKKIFGDTEEAKQFL